MDPGLKEEEESCHSDLYSDERDGLVSGTRRPAVIHHARHFLKLMPLLLFLSLSVNILQLIFTLTGHTEFHSLYAKLPEREKVIPFHYATEYSDDSLTQDDKDALWSAIDVSEGFIAVSNEESDAMGLPRSKTFPWDAKKGMYVSHGYHALHCTTLLWAYTSDAHRGKTPLVSYHHVQHCLDLLRQDIICYADDFLDYTKDHGDEFLVAENQPRMCRDWSKLSAWVKERSSCYKTVNITRAGEDHGISHQLERYTFCPEGSPYIPVIKAWRDLNRPNPGNLNKDAMKNFSEAEKEAQAQAISEHNRLILADGP